MLMTHLILTADPLGLAATGVASYLFYVRAVCYAIAAVICIVGALSVYSDMMDGEPEVRMKVMRLAFSCVFLVTASTALPRFFGLDATTAELSSGGGSSSDDNSPRQIGTGIIGIGDPYVIQLPDGGRGIIWGRDRRM
jgi:hypothetical protein